MQKVCRKCKWFPFNNPRNVPCGTARRQAGVNSSLCTSPEFQFFSEVVKNCLNCRHSMDNNATEEWCNYGKRGVCIDRKYWETVRDGRKWHQTKKKWITDPPTPEKKTEPPSIIIKTKEIPTNFKFTGKPFYAFDIKGSGASVNEEVKFIEWIIATRNHNKNNLKMINFRIDLTRLEEFKKYLKDDSRKCFREFLEAEKIIEFVEDWPRTRIGDRFKVSGYNDDFMITSHGNEVQLTNTNFGSRLCKGTKVMNTYNISFEEFVRMIGGRSLNAVTKTKGKGKGGIKNG